MATDIAEIVNGQKMGPARTSINETIRRLNSNIATVYENGDGDTVEVQQAWDATNKVWITTETVI